ncbi:MAG: type II toxin-antitoxin system Phd/YefM family antitoxin, partial [Thermomicrobiales bacterium]
MIDRWPSRETITATDARREFARVINRVARNEVRVVVEKSGVPVAGIVSAEDVRRLDRLDQLERERAARFGVIDEMRAAFAGVPAEELGREAERALAEVRSDMRAERDAGPTAR